MHGAYEIKSDRTGVLMEDVYTFSISLPMQHEEWAEKIKERVDKLVEKFSLIKYVSLQAALPVFPLHCINVEVHDRAEKQELDDIENALRVICDEVTA